MWLVLRVTQHLLHRDVPEARHHAVLHCMRPVSRMCFSGQLYLTSQLFGHLVWWFGACVYDLKVGVPPARVALFFLPIFQANSVGLYNADPQYVTGSEKTDYFVMMQFVSTGLKRCQGHEVGTSQ